MGEVDGNAELAQWKAYYMSAMDQIYNMDEWGLMCRDPNAAKEGTRQVMGGK